MNLRSHITLLLSVAIMTVPLLSGSAPECEPSCCTAQENACSMDGVQECPFLEADRSQQQQSPALQNSPDQSVVLTQAVAASEHLLVARDLILPPGKQAPPRLCAPLSIPLIV